MTNLRKPLTPRQRAILCFVEEQISTIGYPPSVREIGEAVGLSSSSTVHSHLRSLEKKGYLRRDPSKPRALTVLDAESSSANTAPNGRAVASTSSDDPTYASSVTRVPMIGRVAAGVPILATENYEETLPLPSELVGSGELYILEVQGDSMVDAGILDGDMVVVRKQQTASNGEIVVAMIGEEATVKRFKKTATHVELIAENPNYAPILTRDAVILGKVVAVLRSLR